MRILTEVAATVLTVFTVGIASLPLDNAVTVEYTIIERQISCFKLCHGGGRCDNCDLENGTPGFCCNSFDYSSCNIDMVNAVRSTSNRDKAFYQCVVPNIPGLTDMENTKKGIITDKMYKEAFKFIWPYWQKSGSTYKRKENYAALTKLFYHVMETRQPMQNSKVIFPWKLASDILDAVEEAAIDLEDDQIDERINAFGYAKTSHSFPIFRISMWLLNQFDAAKINVYYRENNLMKLTRSKFNEMIPDEIDALYEVLYEEVAHFDPIQKAVYEMFKKMNTEGLLNEKSLDAIRMALTQIETESVENNFALAEIFQMLKEEIILDQLLSPLEVATMFKIISLDFNNLKSVAAYVEVLKGNIDFDSFPLNGAIATVHQLMEIHHIYQNVMVFFFEKVNNLTLNDAAEESFESELHKCLSHIPRPTVANPLIQLHRNLEKCLPTSYQAELAIMLKYNDNIDVLNLILTIIAAYDSNENLANGEIESLFGCDIQCNFQLDEEDWRRINVKENHDCDASGIIIDSVFDLIDSFGTTEVLEIEEPSTRVTGVISGVSSKDDQEIIDSDEKIDLAFIERLLKTGVFQSEINNSLNACDLAKCSACKDPLLTQEKIAGITTLSCLC